MTLSNKLLFLPFFVWRVFNEIQGKIHSMFCEETYNNVFEFAANWRRRRSELLLLLFLNRVLF
jgi:hypothetical protein